MIKVGINGFGRIGRSIFRINLENKEFDIKLINDIDPDINNHSYLLEFDCTYGKLEKSDIKIEGSSILSADGKTVFTSFESIDLVPWEKYDVDLIIDATGIEKNVKKGNEILENKNVMYHRIAQPVLSPVLHFPYYMFSYLKHPRDALSRENCYFISFR